MDEYLFLVMAKLRADRLKLAREDRDRRVWASPVASLRDRHVEALEAADLRRIKRSLSNVEWREQS